MQRSEIRAVMWEDEGLWRGRLTSPLGRSYSGRTRAACLARLRKAAGSRASLIVEVEPRLAGVAEAAAILGWDKRRVFTYISRGSFPEPVALLASGRVWRREDIETYARERRARRGNRSPASGRGDAKRPRAR